MTINQEEGGSIENFFFANVGTVLKLVEEYATDTYCDTEMLNEAVDIATSKLNDFKKHIAKVEAEESKKSKKEKILERMKRATDFD